MQNRNYTPLKIPSKISAQTGYPKRFGEYLLLDHMTDGGMSEIYRACKFLQTPEMGIPKMVIIKLLLHKQASVKKFRALFLDEIRVSSQMLHPNIVQTYDYGEIDGRPFASMEYVCGKSLDYYLKLANKAEKKFSINLAVFIAIQIAKGLHHAHQSINAETGLTNDVVHRDISPQNIMLDYQGAVKIIDFGVAKAKSNKEKTETGFLKGKISYMGPEALTENTPVDHRYDQFCTSLVLWELLTGKKLFRGEDVLEVTRRVFECQIPDISKINPDIPERLKQILDKSLSKQREDRFQDMKQYADELSKFLNESNLAVSSKNLATFLQTEFAESYSALNRELQELDELALTGLYPEKVKPITNIKTVEKPPIVVPKEPVEPVKKSSLKPLFFLILILASIVFYVMRNWGEQIGQLIKST